MTALVPEIGIAPLLDGTQGTKRTVAEKIKATAIDTGFSLSSATGSTSGC